MKTGKRWFTSDHHFTHGNVAKIRGFEDAKEQDEYLIKKWYENVKPEDIVYMLGDVTGLASGDQLIGLLEMIATLPGRKRLVNGNHDAPSSIHKQSWKYQRLYLNYFESVQDFAKIKINGNEILLSHYPYSGDHTAEDRYEQFRLKNCGNWLLHGHTHLKNKLHDGKQIHVGVDAWGFAPVSESQIVKLVHNGEEK